MTDTWRLGLAAAFLMAVPSASVADDWTASRLFGQVLQLIDGRWQPVARGDLVPDGRVIRTVGFGRATFTRGNETVDVGSNTQIQIFDEKRQKPFTTVKQYFGTVSVEAQVEQVQHFAVQTPYLAAVVKGTRFTVTSGDSGASVSVQRGHVAVEDQNDHTHVLIAVGQSAKVDKLKTDGSIEVSGDGDLPEVVAASVPLSGIAHGADAGRKTEKSGDGSSGKANVDGGGGNGNGGNGNGGDGGNGNGGDGGNGKSAGGNGNSGGGNSGGDGRGKDKQDASAD